MYLLNVLDDFVGKKINIFLTSAPNLQLSLSGDNLIAISKYLSRKKYNYDDTAKISKNGKKYEIEIGNEKICIKDYKLVKCESNSETFSIKEKQFGFTISKKGKCFTKSEGTEVRLENCTYTNDQIFNFKKISTLDCLENKIKVPKKENNKKLSLMNEIKLFEHNKKYHRNNNRIVKNFNYEKNHYFIQEPYSRHNKKIRNMEEPYNLKINCIESDNEDFNLY